MIDVIENYYIAGMTRRATAHAIPLPIPRFLFFTQQKYSTQGDQYAMLKTMLSIFTKK